MLICLGLLDVFRVSVYFSKIFSDSVNENQI
jgi:hypothetical protein